MSDNKSNRDSHFSHHEGDQHQGRPDDPNMLKEEIAKQEQMEQKTDHVSEGQSPEEPPKEEEDSA